MDIHARLCPADQTFLLSLFRYGEAALAMSKLMKEGKLKQQFTINEGGLEGCADALVGLFAGKNKGKMVVKIA